MAEWSKALDLGSSLSGGVGSNPTAAKTLFEVFLFPVRTSTYCNPGNFRKRLIFVLFVNSWKL